MVLEKILESIDKMIAEKSKDWKIERMSGIDRNIVRLAIFEMKFSSDKLVPNIAINEAVELAKNSVQMILPVLLMVFWAQ